MEKKIIILLACFVYFLGCDSHSKSSESLCDDFTLFDTLYLGQNENNIVNHPQAQQSNNGFQFISFVGKPAITLGKSIWIDSIYLYQKYAKDNIIIVATLLGNTGTFMIYISSNRLMYDVASIGDFPEITLNEVKDNITLEIRDKPMSFGRVSETIMYYSFDKKGARVHKKNLSP